MNVPKPKWFKENEILISNPMTCGINKDGLEQYKVNLATGERSKTEIDNEMIEAVREIMEGDIKKPFTNYVDKTDLMQSRVIVPQYHDNSFLTPLEETFKENEEFELISFKELIDKGYVTIFNGHGSPSSDQRVGDIPYIKVSDIRAGNININPSNMIPIDLAKKFWKGDFSNLEPYDLLSPERASKNIGEFSVLMPGQENVVLTKEIIVVRSTKKHFIDQFYLLWALSLKVVRLQWDRIILMQTNREDVGDRFDEIILPFPKSKEVADKYSQHFRKYYHTIETAREEFNDSLINSKYEYHIKM